MCAKLLSPQARQNQPNLCTVFASIPFTSQGLATTALLGYSLPTTGVSQTSSVERVVKQSLVQIKGADRLKGGSLWCLSLLTLSMLQKRSQRR